MQHDAALQRGNSGVRRQCLRLGHRHQPGSIVPDAEHQKPPGTPGGAAPSVNQQCPLRRCSAGHMDRPGSPYTERRRAPRRPRPSGTCWSPSPPGLLSASSGRRIEPARDRTGGLHWTLSGTVQDGRSISIAVRGAIWPGPRRTDDRARPRRCQIVIDDRPASGATTSSWPRIPGAHAAHVWSGPALHEMGTFVDGRPVTRAPTRRFRSSGRVGAGAWRMPGAVRRASSAASTTAAGHRATRASKASVLSSAGQPRTVGFKSLARQRTSQAGKEPRGSRQPAWSRRPG